MVDGNQQIRHDQTFMSGGTNHERTPLLGSTSDAWLTNYLPKDMPSMRVSVGGFNVLDSGSDFKSVVENFAKDILNNWTLVSLIRPTFIYRSQLNPYYRTSDLLSSLRTAWVV